MMQSLSCNPGSSGAIVTYLMKLIEFHDIFRRFLRTPFWKLNDLCLLSRDVDIRIMMATIFFRDSC